MRGPNDVRRDGRRGLGQSKGLALLSATWVLGAAVASAADPGAGPAADAGSGPGVAVELRAEGDRVEVRRGDLTLLFDPAGRGFVTRAARGDLVWGAAVPASGLFASLAVARGEAGPLEPVPGEEVEGEARVSRVTASEVAGGATVTISGTCAFAGIGDAPFIVTARVPPEGPALSASVELRPSEAVRRHRLASLGLALPLDLEFHPSSKMDSEVDRKRAAAAILPRQGTPIPEVRWLVAEQDATSVWGPMLWTLAGVRFTAPGAAEVWEAWSPANPPFVLQSHREHPGWMAVADGRRAALAALPGMDAIAPAGIHVDSAARVLRISFQPAGARPLDLGAAGDVLRAGPAHVFLEPAGEETRNAGAWRDARERPALGAVGEASRALERTTASFRAVPSLAPKVRPASREPAVLPVDPAFLSHDPGPADEISIWIDGPTGIDLERFPITRGVPLARGILLDAGDVELRDESGLPVPCASRALAFWPDRSVKWLLLDFPATLRAGVGARLDLRVGARTRRGSAPKGRTGLVASPALRVEESPGRVEVDTGPLRMSFQAKDGKLSIRAGLDFDGHGRVGKEETILASDADLLSCRFSHVAEPARYASGSWIDPGRDDPGTPEILELRVDELSARRAVVLIRADLRHELLATTIERKERPAVGTPVSLRLHFHAGSTLVRLQHTFLFAGDVRHDFLRSLGVRLPLPEGAPVGVRTALDGAELTLAGSRAAAGGAADGSGRREEPAGERPEAQAGILQESADSAVVWRAGGAATPVDGEVVARGDAADGWVDVSLGRWGVTVGLRGMREMFPQEIHVDGSGVWTQFWSPRVPPMDVRRYAFKYGDGESTSTGFGSAFGALRTHEAVWCFRRELAAGEEEGTAAAHPVPGRTRARALVEAMLDPPVARVRPRHVADTLAVGHVAEHGAPSNDAHFDSVLLHMPRMHQHNREFWRWLGFWDWGDEIQVYDAGRDRWAKDEGRYGWYNNEPLRDYDYHLAFLLSGNRRIWRQAEAMSRHVWEVDVRHASPQPFMSAEPTLERQEYDHSTTSGIDLCGRRHNCQHWADGYWGERVGSPAGFRLCYYQTGDPVWREALERQVKAALSTRRSEYRSADGEEAIVWALVCGYEMSLDGRCLERLKAYAKLQVEYAKAHGGFPSAKSNWDWAENRPGAPPEEPNDQLWIWSFGGHVALVELAELLADDDLHGMLRDWTLALEGFGPDGKRREEWSTNMGASPLLAHYYRTTGDARALEWFQKRAKAFHSGLPEGAPSRDPPLWWLRETLPAYTPNDGYGWVYSTSSFWYIGIPAWQGALRAHAVAR